MFPDLPILSVAMHGLDPSTAGFADVAPGGERARRAIAWISSTKVRAIQLDATMPGIRPRELDRSGRRDLAALLRRSELACSGLDCFVPPSHFESAEHVDRAMSAVLSTIEMGAEIASLASGAIVTRASPGVLPVCVQLPPSAKNDIHATIAAKAEACGVRIANLAWPIAASEQNSAATPRGSGGEAAIGIGVDPAQILAAGDDPVKLASTLGERIASARLSDIGRGIGVARVVPGSGQGRLDVLAYLVALATGGGVRHVVLDLRSLSEPARAVETALRACSPSA